MTMQLQDIASSDWSMALDATINPNAPGSGIGEVVQSLDDVAQCIRIILTTPKGSDPLRPDFACDIFAYLDRPATLAVPHIVREVVEAIRTYEPRAIVEFVSVAPVGDGNIGHFTVSVTWRLNITSPPPPRSTIVTIPVMR